VKDILQDHWQTYGRNYYSRHDYEAVDSAAAHELMADLTARLDDLVGQQFGACRVTSADSFSYHDPVDGSVSHNQGLRIAFDGGGRAVLRLSGTGTEGATLRVYLERFEPPSGDLNIETQTALREIAEATAQISGLTERTGRTAPDVMT
jgi:phosphoglucomutase